MHLRMVIRLQSTVCIDKIKTFCNSRLTASGVSYANTIEAQVGTMIGESKDELLKVDAVAAAAGRQEKTKAF